MRLTLFVLILTTIISGCSSTSSSLDFSLESLSLNAIQKKHFKELDTILANDVESRDLLRAKQLVLELKNSVSGNHSRHKELQITERWVNESIDYQSAIKSLQSKITKQKKALEQVRRTLVTE